MKSLRSSLDLDLDLWLNHVGPRSKFIMAMFKWCNEPKKFEGADMADGANILTILIQK